MINDSECEKYKTAEDSSIRLHGISDKSARFVQDKQLLSPELWSSFIVPFRDGIDSTNQGWRGEFWGKMMRGAVMTYQYTRSRRLYSTLLNSVSEMLSVQESNGRISSYLLEKEFGRWDMWCRKYVMLGMEYFLEICKNKSMTKKIVSSLCRQADYIIEHIGPANKGRTPINDTSVLWGGLNSSSILEPMVKLYRITGCKKYIDFAEYIIDEGGSSRENIFTAALEDNKFPYQYNVTKAYEMMSFFEGVIEYYRVTGREDCRKAAVNFGKRVRESEVTVIGSCGCTHELFDHAAVRQTFDPGDHDVMQETCVSVTWMKLCERLFRLSGDSQYLDCIEQTYYNALLGAINTENRCAEDVMRNDSITPNPLAFDSYSPLVPGTRGRMTGGFQVMEDNSYFGCCAAIAAAGIGLFPSHCLYKSDNAVLVGFYENGTISTSLESGNKIDLKISTRYPAELNVKITLTVEHPERFAVALRIPGWSESTEICVNGDQVASHSGIVAIEREWDSGDVISLVFDDRVKAISAPVYDRQIIKVDINYATGDLPEREDVQKEDARHYISLSYGPLTLGADSRLGRDIRKKSDISCGIVKTKKVPVKDIPYTCIAAKDIYQSSGETVRLTDYSSVGKSWSAESECAAWIPAK